MSDINNPKNAIGIGDILVDDDENIDIDEIEKSITSGIIGKKKEDKNIDLAKDYSREVEDLMRRFKVDDDLETQNNNLDEKLPTDSRAQKTEYKTPYNLVDDDDEDDDTQETYKSNNWSIERPQDEHLNRMTNEEIKQDHVNKVLNNIEKNNDDAEFVEKEDEEDEMARIMEQIDLLKTNLESEGVDLARIPDVNTSTSKREAKAVLRMLQIKNDRLRYCDFFEEGILAMAYGLENVFDGKREVLGSKIDLTGYSDTVKVKLRRMRYDTSNFVSGIMQGYNISSGWRIMLELVPSLFLYSRNRRLTGKDNLISDENYKKAMQDLQ
jgi:hypothetical protein